MNIYVHFVSSLSVAELVILESIIVNFVPWPIEMDLLVKYTKTMNVGNVPVTLGGGWTKVLGNLEGFDPSTGIFTSLENSSYYYKLIVNSTNTLTNNFVTIISVSGDLFGQSFPLVGGVGHAYFDDWSYLFTDNTITHNIFTDVENCEFDFIFKIRKV